MFKAYGCFQDIVKNHRGERAVNSKTAKAIYFISEEFSSGGICISGFGEEENTEVGQCQKKKYSKDIMHVAYDQLCCSG